MADKTISLEDLNQILMQFGQNIGLHHLILDENAAVSLVFDDQFLVEIQALDRQNDRVRTVYLLAVLSPSPQHKDSARAVSFYQKLLEANLSGAMMNGTAFAVDPENQETLLLSAVATSTLTVEILENEMEKFVNTLERWVSIRKNGIFDLSQAADRPGMPSGSAASEAPSSIDHGSVRV